MPLEFISAYRNCFPKPSKTPVFSGFCCIKILYLFKRDIKKNSDIGKVKLSTEALAVINWEEISKNSNLYTQYLLRYLQRQAFDALGKELTARIIIM